MKSRELSVRIGVLLRELRKDRGLSQRAAAERVGWPQPKLSLLEQGRLDFGALELVVGLADELGVAPAEVLATALGEAGPDARPGADRAWLLSASRLLTVLTEGGKALVLDRVSPFQALGADAPPARWVMALVRARAFGAVPSGAHASGWILPFAPSLIRLGCEELERAPEASALTAEARAAIGREAQRFALAHDLAARPAEALALADALAAEYPMPEIEYLRGVLHHQLGATPLVVKGCVQRALDRLDERPPTDLRADLVVAGLLAQLEVAADAAEHAHDTTTPASERRIDRAIRLLDAAGFAQGRVHLEVRRAVADHERLRVARTPASRATPAVLAPDATWIAEWHAVAAVLARARAEYQALGVAMGTAYVEDWLARHHELAGEYERALDWVASAAHRYRDLGQRRWECSAEIRAAHYRAALAFAVLGVHDDAAVTGRRLAGAAGDRAVALLDETRARVEALLASGDVTPYERPLLEIHRALAAGRLAGFLALRRGERGRIDALARGYRAAKDAALAQLDDEVDATEATRRDALASFRALERAHPLLRGGSRTGARTGRDTH